MSVTAFFAATGLVLLALLFVADATTTSVVVAAQPKSKTVASIASPGRDEMLSRLAGYGQKLPDRFSVRGANNNPSKIAGAHAPTGPRFRFWLLMAFPL
jgi:hypothetical protein